MVRKKAPSRKAQRAPAVDGSAWALAWHHRPPALEHGEPSTPYELDLGWDGHRVIAARHGADVRLFADDLREWTSPFASVAHALASLPVRDVVLDGFVCALTEDGRPSFERLRGWASGERLGPLIYAAWDLFRLDGVDLRGEPLPKRRQRLAELLAEAPAALVRSDALQGAYDVVLRSVTEAGLPGVFARPVTGPGPGFASPGVKLNRPLSPRPRVTNSTKVLYPRDGITKRDVVDYYASVAQVMLPLLRDRPIVCQRWPDGIDDFMWFQHRVPPRAPDFIRAVNIDGNRRIVLDSADALEWMANQAALTLHGWATRVGRLAEPDWVVFDLDPGERSTWADVIDVAVALRKLLELLEVPSLVKTSGQTGLHVLVPLAHGHSVTQAHEFAQRVSAMIQQLKPDAVALTAQKGERRGRLLLDHLQNFAGKTLVLPYSLRGVDGAQASAPIEWSEVTPALSASAFTLRTMRNRLDQKGDLFAAALAGQTQLQPLIQKLGGAQAR